MSIHPPLIYIMQVGGMNDLLVNSPGFNLNTSFVRAVASVSDYLEIGLIHPTLIKTLAEVGMNNQLKCLWSLSTHPALI